MHTIKSTLVLWLLASVSGALSAQTPTDAIMMRQKETCIAAVYQHSWFDEYWEGENLRTNATIATVRRNMASGMLAIGILDRLNLLAGLPYVQTASTEPNGGKFAGARGIQDLSLALKGKVFEKPLGPGKLAFLAVAGFSMPMSNYASDYRPYSIGFGAPEWSLRGMLEYRLDMGLYFRGALAHLWRGTTEAERDYYYNNGSYYTSTMDVPNAWNINAATGIWLLDEALRLELTYQSLSSTSGDDIRPYSAPQPTNRVAFGQAGGFGQYYFGKARKLGVLAFCSATLHGRNEGKSTLFGAGLNYIFPIGKQKK